MERDENVIQKEQYLENEVNKKTRSKNETRYL